MTMFDDRDKGFENKFAHEEEISFKINARRTRLIGLWTAEKLGKPEAERDVYALQLLDSMVSNKSETALLDKLQAELGTKATLKEIRTELERLSQVARQQILGGAA